MTLLYVLLIILLVLVIALVVMYVMGRKLQKKQAAQQEQLEAAKQTVSMLIIDKKRLPIKESGLPQMVIDQTPKLMRRSKLPIVKAKVGPRIMTLVSDASIFDSGEEGSKGRGQRHLHHGSERRPRASGDAQEEKGLDRKAPREGQREIRPGKKRLLRAVFFVCPDQSVRRKLSLPLAMIFTWSRQSAMCS